MPMACESDKFNNKMFSVQAESDARSKRQIFYYFDKYFDPMTKSNSLECLFHGIIEYVDLKSLNLYYYR